MKYSALVGANTHVMTKTHGAQNANLFTALFERHFVKRRVHVTFLLKRLLIYHIR